MTVQNVTTVSTKISTVLWWLMSIPLKIVHFFSPLTPQYPNDESGVLMRRHMAPKSWFDRVSHRWVEQSFFMKTLIALSTILISGCLGLIAGASILCMLSAGLFLLASHTLLLAHESSRREGVHLFAQESIALNENLQSCQQQLEEAIQKTQKITEQLHQQSDAITIQIDSFDTESKIIEQCNKDLITEISAVTEETTQLVRQEHLFTENLKTMSDDLVRCDQAIIQTTATISTADESMTQFSSIVSKALEIQEKISQATNQFNFFVTEEILGKTPSALRDNNFLNQLQAKNNEHDLLIATWNKMLTI